jgi:hypothetical protein
VEEVRSRLKERVETFIKNAKKFQVVKRQQIREAGEEED